MKPNISKQTLSFSCSKKMKYLRTPTDIWEDLSSKYDFTCDMCASDENHLVDKYYTIEDNSLKQDWTDEVGYIHPLFDGKIGKFVEKAYLTRGFFVFLLPASTHTKYFHEYLYHNPNVTTTFLRKPKKGFRFGADDGSPDDPEALGYIKSLMICVMDNTELQV